MAPETLTRRFIVHGRVQGVGFRYFVQNEAVELGLSGYVKNRADGTVEVCACGDRDQMKELAKRLEEGPRWARVDRVDESDASPAFWDSFRIEY